MHAGLFSWEHICEWAGRGYSPLLTCLAWDMVSSLGLQSSTREMRTNGNEFTWLETGAHNVRGKTKETGSGDSGGFSPTSYTKGAYRGDGASFPQRYTAKGQDATLTRCSEGNPDERHGKKIFTLGESVGSPSLEICRTCWRQLRAIRPNFEASLEKGVGLHDN